MSLATQEKYYYPSKIRSRGSDYFHCGFVGILERTSEKVLAIVENGGGGSYDVTIEFVPGTNDIEMAQMFVPVLRRHR